MKKKVIVLGAVVVSVGLMALLVFVLFWGEGHAQTEDVLIPVTVTVPHNGTIQRSLYYSGTLKPETTITVMSKVVGRIEKLYVKMGDKVHRGQILLRIEQEVAALQVDQAYSAWKAAEAQYRKVRSGPRKEEIENMRALVLQARKDFSTAEEAYLRAERLFDSGAVAKVQFEEAERSYSAARTQLENAERTLKLMEQGATREELTMAEENAEALKAQYELAKLQFSYTIIEAPMDGIVADILVDQGNLVGQTTPILVIVKDNPIIIEVPVPEKHYNEIVINRNSIIAYLDSGSGENTNSFQGTLSNVSAVIDPRSRTFAVEITVDNSRGVLRPGMYVNVELVVEHYTDALLLPRSAVLHYDGTDHVFLIQEQSNPVAVLKQIEVGISDDSIVQILAGLNGTEKVISQGNAFLEDGQAVRIIDN
ncbi:MAG: efflux RND transporter periplasmic adaptor subunit [Spirochaetales bacterium]|nr:efflux RND transporter periplasmic adaptor subunit [Spirochaetales bacterium]